MKGWSLGLSGTGGPFFLGMSGDLPFNILCPRAGASAASSLVSDILWYELTAAGEFFLAS